MESFAADWLNLLFRWAHLIAGVGWIGTSFYFIGLDLSLRKREGLDKDVYGSAWQVHGGGFYNVEKYLVAPKKLPDDLVWFKWEAYLTWVTGFALLVVQYYYNASSYLIDPNVMALEPWQAISISVASLIGGWLIYDGICRSPLGKNTSVLAVCLFILIMAASILFSHVFSGRGALIHVGAFVGTIMAVNVFGIIIPNQKKVAAALMRGEEPEARFGIMGKQRSVHNNYLTLPVLLMMVSNHYPMLTGHPHSWLLVALILIIGGAVRHLLNRHEAGDSFKQLAWTFPVAGVGVIVAMIMTAPVERDYGSDRVTDTVVMDIVQTHCTTCHATNPSVDWVDEAPQGVKLESIADIKRYLDRIKAQSVDSDAMPLGNETGMTEDERTTLGAWIAQNKE